MTRVLSFFALLLALVALSAPSASLGMGVTGPVWTLVDAQTSVAAPTKVISCKSMGGKRIMPCHPDLGVLAALKPVTIPQSEHSLVMTRAVAPMRIPAPEAELPPPRAA